MNKISLNEYPITFQVHRIDEILWDSRSLTQKLNDTYKVVIDTQEMPENEELLEIKADDKLILTAFKNLMENACKFSTNKTAFVKLQIENQHIKIDFKNEGKGIPAADLPFIFQPFFRAENTAASKGYGIGLSLVERIIQLHNGIIQVQSEPNSWTVFTVMLPIK